MPNAHNKLPYHDESKDFEDFPVCRIQNLKNHGVGLRPQSFSVKENNMGTRYS